MGEYTGGYTSAVNDISRRDFEDAETARVRDALMEAMSLRVRQQKARESAVGEMGIPPPPGGPQPPMPGQASQPGIQAQGQGGPPGPPPAGMPPPPGPPGPQMMPASWRPSPVSQMRPQPPMGGLPGGGAPGASPAGGASPGMPAPQQMPPPPPKPSPEQIDEAGTKVMPAAGDWVKQTIQSMQKKGKSAGEIADTLEVMKGWHDDSMKDQYHAAIIDLKAEEAATRAYKAESERLTAQLKGVTEERRAAQGEERIAQGDRKIDLMAAKLSRGGGSGGEPALKGTEYIYPRTPDGKVDESKEPIGTRSLTKQGKMVVKDLEGNETTLAKLGGGTAKEGKDSKIGITNVVRQNIVKAGVKNSLDRLDEIEKKFPNDNTSSFFGQSAENPVTRTAYGAGRSMQSSKQKQADAAWASFIDEAIPVFTGGLRGSDAFRRFLIEQAPGPGDDAGSRAEKRRLIRANIQGTSKAFFNKFASDPTFWQPGTKPEDVEAAKLDGGGAGKGEWKVEPITGK